MRPPLLPGGYPLVGWLAPLWITALWAGFAATLLHSLAFLRGRRWLAALFGALGGPLSFYGGAQLGVLSLGPSPGLALVVLALGWSIAIPALYAFAAWSERERARSRRLALQTDRRPRAATAPARLPLRPTSDAGSARLSQS